MVAYIDAHRDEFGVESICKVLRVAPSTYYAAKGRQLSPSARAARDTVMMQVLMVLWVANRRVYGAHKLWKAARRAGHDIGRDQVARLMRAMAIEGVSRRRKRVFTTVADPDAVRAPDLVKRNFCADRPDALWVTDLTYVPTRTGMGYVCFIVDAFSRRIVGWRVATHMRTDMVLDALEMARRSRGSRRLVGFVAHADAGSQGGFKWSSQHLSTMEVCSGATAADGGQGASPGDAFARTTDPGATCGARVLATHRPGQAHRGSSRRCRGVGPCRVALVSSRWRHDASAPCGALGPVSVVRGA